MDFAIVAAGAFSLSGAVFDWEWFMNHRKARPFVEAFGRESARMLYGFLGFALIAFGLMKASGVLQTCES